MNLSIRKTTKNYIHHSVGLYSIWPKYRKTFWNHGGPNNLSTTLNGSLAITRKWCCIFWLLNLPKIIRIQQRPSYPRLRTNQIWKPHWNCSKCCTTSIWISANSVCRTRHSTCQTLRIWWICKTISIAGLKVMWVESINFPVHFTRGLAVVPIYLCSISVFFSHL